MDALEKIKANLIKFKEELVKRAPKGVDPDKHERCVQDLKDEGKSVGSAHAICTSSMKKQEGGADHPGVLPFADRKPKPNHPEKYDSIAKDETDEKIKAKLKAEMDKRKFGEAEATRHIIDRDRGEKMPKPPKKPKQLLQSEGGEEVYKTSDLGQWSIEKSNYGPKGMGLYNPTDNIERKANRTGEEFADVGRNKAAHRYTTSGSSMQQAHESVQNKIQAKKTKASTRTLKDMSPEERADLEAKYNTKIKG